MKARTFQFKTRLVYIALACFLLVAIVIAALATRAQAQELQTQSIHPTAVATGSAAPVFHLIPDNKLANALEYVTKRLEGQRAIPPVTEGYWIFIPRVIPLQYKKQGTMILEDWEIDDTAPSAILLISKSEKATTWTLGMVDVLWEEATKSKHAELPMPFSGGMQVYYQPPQGKFKRWKKESWADASLAEAPTGNTVARRYLSYNPFRDRYASIFASDPRFGDFYKLYKEVLKQKYNVKV